MTFSQPGARTFDEIGRLLVFEPTRARGNATIILAAVSALFYFALLGVYIGRYAVEITEIAGTVAVGIEGVSHSVIGKWIQGATDPAVRSLFARHSPVLVAFCWLAMLGVPWFAMLIASDQTSSEFGRRHVRFLLPRVSRRALFLARFAGAWLTWVLLSGSAVFIVGLILSACDPAERIGSAPVLLFRLVVALAVYGMPFIAIMAFINTFIPNPFVAYLTGSGICSLIALLGWIGSWINEAYAGLEYLAPSIVKYPLMSSEVSRFTAGVGGSFVYTLVFLGLGDWIFRSRDT